MRIDVSGYTAQRENRMLLKKIDTLTRSFQLVAIFNGHDGDETVEYLAKHFATELEVQLNILDTTIQDALTVTFEKIDLYLLFEMIGQSGSTCVMALMEEGTFDMWCAHIGDSRMNIGDAIVTKDHTPISEIDRIRDSRGIHGRGGWVDSRGYLLGKIGVSRSFGDHEFKQRPRQSKKQSSDMIIATPTISHHAMSPGDVVTLANGTVKIDY